MEGRTREEKESFDYNPEFLGDDVGDDIRCEGLDDGAGL